MNKIVVGVIGTGPVGQAIASRLAQNGILVRLGTRDPEKTSVSIHGSITVCSVREAIQGAGVIILCLPAFCQEKLGWLRSIEPGTVLLEITNRRGTLAEGKLSQAELLARRVPPGVSVVKSLNVLELQDLQGTGNWIRDVPLCGDSNSAKNFIVPIISLLGHRAVDYGGLEKAGVLENQTLRLFPTWRSSLAIASVTWLLLFFIDWLRELVCDHGEETWDFPRTSRAIFSTVQHASSAQALILLAAAKLPHTLTDYILLIRGTKYVPLPAWLIGWSELTHRLQPLALFSLCVHSWLSLYLEVYTPSAVPAGVLSYLFTVCVCLLLVPQSTGFSRRELNIVFALLSWFALVLAYSHTILAKWERLAELSCIPASFQLSILLPSLSIPAQLPLLLPWIRKKVLNIRNGHVYSGIYYRKQ